MNLNNTFRYMDIGLPEDILRLKLAGDFDAAIALIDKHLALATLPDSMKKCLTVHREIMVRMPRYFTYTYEDALSLIRCHIPDFAKEELDNYISCGLVRWIFIKKERRIIESFFDTLCKTDPSFAARTASHLPGGESAVKGTSGANILDRSMALIKENGTLSNRIRVRASLKVKEEAFTPGMFIRAHLPIPAACDRQSDIVIEKVFPESGLLAPKDALQRTVCWEEFMEENQEFFVEYSYIHTATYNDTEAMISMKDCSYKNPGNVLHNKAALDSCIEEHPHIVFTPYIKALVASLSQGIETPLEMARKFYDYITLNMKYTFMPEYFVLDSIADNCARNKTGDCGVFALLFITMCRCAGIPARWQSGLAVEPDYIGAHDWAQFYIAPYGWLYADPSFGIGAVRGENEERRRFYFGNLDAYRMVANHAFQVPFTVEKKFWRCDPYDNQVGEIETDTRGLTYDEFTCQQEILLLEEI